MLGRGEKRIALAVDRLRGQQEIVIKALDPAVSGASFGIAGATIMGDGRVVLIAGGRDKGGSYAPLREVARRKTKLVLTIGEAGPAIAKALKGGVEVVPADTLDRAVRVAVERARPGDTVLLSPACSSFDQFRDYKDRGNTFQRLVKQL